MVYVLVASVYLSVALWTQAQIHYHTFSHTQEHTNTNTNMSTYTKSSTAFVFYRMRHENRVLHIVFAFCNSTMNFSVFLSLLFFCFAIYMCFVIIIIIAGSWDAKIVCGFLAFHFHSLVSVYLCSTNVETCIWINTIVGARFSQTIRNSLLSEINSISFL